MSINSLIINTLKPINVPVEFLYYEDDEDPYITFHDYNEKGVTYSDNSEESTGIYIQVDVFSKHDYTEVVEKTKELMIDAGFSKTGAFSLYEQDTGVYHKVLRFFYLDEKE